MVFVISKSGKPLMPTKRHDMVRVLLKEKKAKVVQNKPFIIQLLFKTTEYVEPVKLGIDSGYTYIGYSAVTDDEELISGEKGFKEATFMTLIRKRLVDKLNCQHTFGYITKSKRIEQDLDKTHYNDAFVIAGGS